MCSLQNRIKASGYVYALLGVSFSIEWWHITLDKTGHLSKAEFLYYPL